MTPKSTQCLLIVEDDPNDRLLIERAFTKARILNPRHAVTDGDEAIAYLSGAGQYADRAAHPLPMMVLLDLKLPRRSGFEVLEWIRARPALRAVPVVVLTSSPREEDIRRAYGAGANSYLVKPVNFDGLHAMVESLGLYWLVLNQAAPADG